MDQETPDEQPWIGPWEEMTLPVPVVVNWASFCFPTSDEELSPAGSTRRHSGRADCSEGSDQLVSWG